MLAHEHRLDFCSICKHEQATVYSQPMPNVKVFICDNCLEAAKYNFIFICMNCQKVHLRAKKLFLQTINDPQLLQAYLDCQDMQIIQGIDVCMECDPRGISEYVSHKKKAGHC